MIEGKKCLISTCVWGEWHTEAFLKLNLRTLIAPSNMPAFASHVQTQYTIFTTKKDRKKIEAFSAFKKLEELVSVDFIELSDEDIGQPIPTHQKIWNMGIRRAVENDSYVMLMPPDVIWSNGSLGHIAKLINQNKKAIFLNWHLRSNADTLIPQFYKDYGDHEKSVNATSRDLVRLSMEHLHPICGAYRRESPNFPHHPEMIFWPIEDEGVLMHVLALTPFVFDPKQITLTTNKLVGQFAKKEDLHFVSDSDDLYMISLAKIGKDSEWYRRNQPLDYVSIARWWLYYESPMNDILAATPYRLHFHKCTEEKWRNRETEARILLRRLIWTRELYRIYLAAKKMNCKLAASIIATALHNGLAAHFIRKKSLVNVHLPTDDALEEIWDDQIHPILQSHAKRSLIRYLRNHFIEAPAPESATNYLSMSLYNQAEGGVLIDQSSFYVQTQTKAPTKQKRKKRS